MSRPLRVSELALRLKEELAAFGALEVVGEIGQFQRHRSGHWYFTLVDEGAVLNAVMFRGDARRVPRPPAVGDRVIVTCRLDLYAPSGRLSLIVRSIRPAGEGDRLRQLEALKRRLAAEGLFDPARKRRLPMLPRAVGVVTSPTGAALRDILQVLGRRFPGMPVYLAGCRVQGDEAPREIVDALRRIEEHGLADVVILGRGGGSAEDLAAFNDEAVVRAVAGCRVPVVSAVGHETDLSLTDLAADVRAPTPSAAAELVVPEQATLLLSVDEAAQRMEEALRRRIEAARRRLADLRLLHPGRRLEQLRRRVEELEDRLGRASRDQVDRARQRLGRDVARLEALSPLSVLGRGYAIVQHEGRAVRSAAELAVGDRVDIRFASGGARARIEHTWNDGAVPPREES